MICDLMINDKLPGNSPIGDMYKVNSKYGMNNMLRKCIISNEYGNIISHKRIIKTIIWEHETKCWRASCLLYPELRTHCDQLKGIKLLGWWIFACNYPQFYKKICAVVAVLMGAQPNGMQRNLGNSSFNAAYAKQE